MLRSLTIGFIGWAMLNLIGQAAERPNIVVILVDDLGWGDVQCNNPKRGKIPTPHIDQLASQGIRFTDGHSSSGVCSPSRYALLTGRYHWRTRLQNGIVDVWGQPLIAPDRLTIAALAKRQGYQTACVGKWHLGWEWPITAEQRTTLNGLGGKAGGGGMNIVTQVTPEQQAAWKAIFSQKIPGGPTTRGFDQYFGTDVPNWPPYCFIDNDQTVGIPTTLLPAAKLKQNQASKQGPALENWQLENILPSLADRACDFITKSSQQQSPYLLYLPLTTPHTPLAVNKAWQGKSGLNNDCADLIIETDAVVGRVLEAIQKSGQAENTLVFFTSDNGFASYAGAKQLEEQGHFPSGPHRDYKTSVYEGGHRVPYIMCWPKVIAPKQVCSQLVHHADLIATLAAIWEQKLPDNAGEDSFSLMPILRGKTDQPVREYAVSCAASGVPSLRHGDWKLICAPDARDKSAQAPNLQLYNLANDISESKNLVQAEPERVKAMQAILETIITKGRSTSGTKQENDVRVRRYPVTKADN
jgi:arylsulfatase A